MLRRVTASEATSAVDVVAIEEPLEIRIGYSFKDSRHTRSVAVTMRTPGNDEELAAGFLLSEGLVHSPADIEEIRVLGGESKTNEILVELAASVDVEEWRLQRSTLLTSACGLCGKSTIESIHTRTNQANAVGSPISAALVRQLPSLLEQWQPGFGRSGGLHAAASIRSDGTVTAAFEDIGRHNALDKVIGHLFRTQQSSGDGELFFLSSRGSFELVQKTLAANGTVLATVGAPSSLAVELARAGNLTLIGFVRDGYFNIYSGEWRIDS